MNSKIVRLNRAAVGLLAVLGLAFVMSGQENSPTKPGGGLVTDWTSRHLVFSSAGSPEMTAKITKDPRYMQQWARRNFHPVAEGGAPESNDKWPEEVLKAKKKVGMQKDWGLEMASAAVAQGGLTYPAKYSFNTNTASCADYVVYPVGAAGSSTGIGASDIGTVSGTPANAQTATITNGANSDAVTTTMAVAASASGTVSNVPTAGQTATITNGTSDTITATAAAAATDSGTFTAATVTSGQTIKFTSGANSFTLAASALSPATGSVTAAANACFAPAAGSANSTQAITINSATLTTSGTRATGSIEIEAIAAGDTVTVGTTTYTFETPLAGTTLNQVLRVAGGPTDSAQNLYAAINNNAALCQNAPTACFRNVASANSLASATYTGGSETVNLFATQSCVGSGTTLAVSTTARNPSVVVVANTASSNGTTSGTTFAYSSTAATLASAISSAISTNSATDLVTTSNTGAVDSLTATTGGAAGNSTITQTATSGITVAGLSGGTGSASGTNFAITQNNGTADTTAQLATSLAAAITSNGGTVVVSASSGGTTTVSMTSTAANGATGNGITITNGLTGFVPASTTFSGGATLQCATFCSTGGVEYFGITTSAGVADSAATVATNMSNAFNGNVGTVGITASNPSSGVVTITANAAGTAGNSIALSNTASNFVWAHTTLVGGTSFLTGNQYVPINSATGGALTTAQIAANFVTAFNANVGSTGITATQGTGANTNEVIITANTPGAGGDSITATESVTNFAWTTGTLTGGSVGQASIIAYNNLYVGTPAGGGGAAPCGGTTAAPPVKTAWAYNTGGTISTSPTLSLDGTQVAFVQNTPAGAAQLVILKPLTNVGSDAFNNVNTNLTVASSAAVYRSCVAPCMYAITFALDDGTDQPSDGLAPAGSKGSSIWEDYAFDNAYVGDDDGYMHQFSGVFTGDPAEVTTSPWPVAVCPSVCGASGVNVNPLTSPVYDESRNVLYVGDFGGREDWIDVASGNVTPSTGFGAGAQDIYDGPLVDASAGTNGMVYQHVQFDGTDSGIFQFAGQFAAGAAGTEAKTGVVGSGSTGFSFTGSFDNAYYSGAAVGNLYVCGGTTAANGRPAIWDVPITTATNTMGTPAAKTVAMSTAAATCSSITEADNGTTDYVYTSVTTAGNTTGTIACPAGGGGCVMAYTVTPATGNLTTAGTATYSGGVTGIVIDNFVTGSGASNIYFSPLSTAACTTTGTGGCAVQAAQGPGL